jgi:predicted ATP-dependent endonuclease of OLD family
MYLLYLKRVRLQNIKVYKDIEINFTRENGDIRNWTCFLGKNGLGKSILLQCIALALAGDAAIREAMPYPRSWIRNTDNENEQNVGIIEVEIISTDEDFPRIDRPLNLRYFVFGEKGGEVGKTYSSGPGILSDYDNENNKTFNKDITTERNIGYLVCAYGPFRRLPREGERTEGISFKNPRASRLTTFFQEGTPVSDLEEWVVNLEYQSLKYDNVRDKELLNSALLVMEKILPDAKFSRIENRKVMFNTPYGEVPITELSDGYRSVAAWSANLIMHMLKEFRDLRDPLKGSGVVIVDEIDVHLHPGAQRKVINRLKEIFPNIQFIISSHSPFVAQSLEGDEIFTLKQIERETVARQLDISFRGWRADQVLTSDVFGLNSSRDEKTEQDLKRYEELVSRVANKNTSAEIDNELKNLRLRLNEVLPEPGETQEIRNYQEKLRKILDRLERHT